ncbi:hypothetical protein O3M35_011314 [Rhynocoris fuscipes]|uniref:Uncharacterized protein n=1 Tax=Rhynocoris fuscipes TaxID=488301 RepID=A0AAW1CW51_9HEMI
MSKREDKDMVIRATGYHYPKSFYDFLLEMDYNEQLEKEKARLRSLPDNVCEEITINKIPEVSYKNFNPVRHSMLWAKLVKDQKLKDDLIMSIMWYKEKDERLMRESPLLRIMDCIHLPSFIKVALVCLKAAEDVEEIGVRFIYLLFSMSYYFSQKIIRNVQRNLQGSIRLYKDYNNTML